jgi:hypothetical protein
MLLPVSLTYSIDNSEPPVQPVISKVRAMGDAFTAVANDDATIFYNAAGYAIIEEAITTIFSLGIKVNIDESALRLYSALLSGTDVSASGKLDTYLSDTTLALGITGPIYIGRVGNNFGFVFFDSINPVLDTEPGGIFPSAELNAYSDMALVGGYGFAVPFIKDLYGGFNFKVVLRTKSQIEGTILGVLDAFEDTSEIPLSKAVGFGGDIGLLYIPLPWLSVGLMAHDFFGTRFSEWKSLNHSDDLPKSMIKPRITFGVAFFPLRQKGEPKNFNNFVIAIDYADLLDYSSVYSNIKFGVSFNTLKILTIRAGFDGGYPSGGIGFDLNIFHIDVAYFVDELGAYAGADPNQNLMLNFSFKW